MGSPESKKQISQSWAKTMIKVLLDIALLIAIFYAGYIFGGIVFGNCPPIELVEKCYSCSGSVVPINFSGGIQ